MISVEQILDASMEGAPKRSMQGHPMCGVFLYGKNLYVRSPKGGVIVCPKTILESRDWSTIRVLEIMSRSDIFKKGRALILPIELELMKLLAANQIG